MYFCVCWFWFYSEYPSAVLFACLLETLACLEGGIHT